MKRNLSLKHQSLTMERVWVWLIGGDGFVSFGDHFAASNSHVFKLTTKIISTDELAKNCFC